MGHVTYFWNFGTPSISREGFELETSNLSCRLNTEDTSKVACRFIEGDTIVKIEKLCQMMSGRGLVTYFCNFGTPSISREQFELET